MLNAQNKIDNDEVCDEPNIETHHANDTPFELSTKKIKYDITDDDILATSVLFLLAGYETTASLLSYLFYSLAISPDCQQKLYNEIVNYQNSEQSIDYDTIRKMEYLDACVSETLRLYNPAIQVERTASEDYSLGIVNLIFF